MPVHQSSFRKIKQNKANNQKKKQKQKQKTKTKTKSDQFVTFISPILNFNFKMLKLKCHPDFYKIYFS